MNTYYGRKLQKYKQRYNALLGGTVTNEDRRLIIKVLSDKNKLFNETLITKQKELVEIMKTLPDALEKPASVFKYGNWDVKNAETKVLEHIELLQQQISKNTAIINKINADIKASGKD